MKPKRANALRRITDCLGLPPYAAGTDESIEVQGGNTVRVEGARGIHTYEKEVIKIHMKGYLLVLQGRDFDLCRFNDGTMQIVGALQQITWEGA